MRTLLGSILLCATVALAPPQGATLVIANVTLIDGVAATPIEDATVVISGERITEVYAGPAGDVPAGARVIDGTGRFLIPGLWDSHAHLSYWGADALEMLLAAGVTSIRELGGDPDEIGGWMAEIADRRRPGPSMIWCGPFLEGPEGGDEYRFKIATVDEARYAARALQALGVDFLKIQPAIEVELVEALVDEGEDLGLSVVGHLPRGTTAIEGAALGLRSIEHMGPYLRLDDAAVDATIAAFLQHGTWMSPALFSMVAPLEARGDDPAADPTIRRAFEIVRRFHGAGVPILVGSNFAYRDWPQVPGAGLHGEMRALVQAGIDAMDVIRLTTARAAEFAGRSGEVGTVRPGMRADVVLLDADPLANIRNSERIALVVQGGRPLEQSSGRPVAAVRPSR